MGRPWKRASQLGSSLWTRTALFPPLLLHCPLPPSTGPLHGFASKAWRVSVPNLYPSPLATPVCTQEMPGLMAWWTTACLCRLPSLPPCMKSAIFGMCLLHRMPPVSHQLSWQTNEKKKTMNKWEKENEKRAASQGSGAPNHNDTPGGFQWKAACHMSQPSWVVVIL